jgi:hypothetical protein
MKNLWTDEFDIMRKQVEEKNNSNIEMMCP